MYSKRKNNNKLVCIWLHIPVILFYCRSFHYDTPSFCIFTQHKVETCQPQPDHPRRSETEPADAANVHPRPGRQLQRPRPDHWSCSHCADDAERPGIPGRRWAICRRAHCYWSSRAVSHRTAMACCCCRADDEADDGDGGRDGGGGVVTTLRWSTDCYYCWWLMRRPLRTRQTTMWTMTRTTRSSRTWRRTRTMRKQMMSCCCCCCCYCYSSSLWPLAGLSSSASISCVGFETRF